MTVFDYEPRKSTKRLRKRSRNKQLKKQSGYSKDLRPEYIKDENEAVPVAKYKNKPGYLRLEINATTAILMTGPSGAGKTTADMSIATRTHGRGRIPVNMADTDLHTTNLDNHGGVSKKLVDAMGLYEDDDGNQLESPKEISQKTLLPKYLCNRFGKPDNVEAFTLGFQDVNDSELKFLLSQGLDKKKTNSIEKVLQETSMEELSKKENPYEFLKDLCREEDSIHHQTLPTLEGNIDVLRDREVISNRYRKDVVQYVENGYALGLGMKGFLRLNSDDYYLMEFYAKKVAELLVDARLENELSKSLMGVLPEAHHLMPRNSGSEFAEVVKKNLTLYQRRTDFPMILDTQNPSQLPEKILDEVNHIFIGCDKNGKSLAKSEWTTVLNKLNVVSNYQGEYSDWSDLIGSLGHRDFLYVSPRMSGVEDAVVVRFLAPLTSNP